jgi:hypothetical protein
MQDKWRDYLSHISFISLMAINEDTYNIFEIDEGLILEKKNGNARDSIAAV